MKSPGDIQQIIQTGLSSVERRAKTLTEADMKAARENIAFNRECLRLTLAMDSDSLLRLLNATQSQIKTISETADRYYPGPDNKERISYLNRMRYGFYKKQMEMLRYICEV